MTAQLRMPELDPDRFTVAILCALVEEIDTIEASLDSVYDSHFRAPRDDNIYVLGKIGPSDVVLTQIFPVGKVGAAHTAQRLKSSFRNVNLSLLIGVCGGVPCRNYREASTDIFLGDLVISTGLVQYDLGRHTGGLYPSPRGGVDHNLYNPHPSVATLSLRSRTMSGQESLREEMSRNIQSLLSREKFSAWIRPRQVDDVLFEPDHIHRHQSDTLQPCGCSDVSPCSLAQESSCRSLGCDLSRSVTRMRQRNAIRDRPGLGDLEIHWGLVASGDSVIRAGNVRDCIARERRVIAFEMEGAGIWNELPTLIVKAICDYADSHKNKMWQRYAAIVAASGARALLLQPSQMPARARNSTAEVFPGSRRDSSTICEPFDRLLRVNQPVWSVPILPDEVFIGRDAQLARIEAELPLGQCPKIVVEGLGGVGKTRLVLEVARRLRIRRPDQNIFWIQCSSSSSFERDCRRVLHDLEVPAAGDLTIDIRPLFKRHLEERCKHWLLILDNADDESLWSRTNTNQILLLSNYIPRASTGAVLVTTRNHRVAVDITRRQIIALRQLEEEDSVLLLNNLVTKSETLTTREASLQLVNYLAHLPLAIVQAAAFLNHNNISDIEVYLNVWRNNTEDEIIKLLNEDFSDESRYSDSQTFNPVAKTWLISFRHIEERCPLAAQILFHMACLDANKISKSAIPRLQGSPMDQETAFGVLKNFAFVENHQGESNDMSFSMHRLVHLAARNYLRSNQLFALKLIVAAGHLCTLIPGHQHNATTYWHQYLPHAEKVASASVQDWPYDLHRAQLQDQLSSAYLSNGLYTKSLVHRQNLVNWLEQQGMESRLATNRSMLSEVLRLSGRWEESFKIAERAYRALSVGDPDRLPATRALARAYAIEGLGKPVGMAMELSNEAVNLAAKCQFSSEARRWANIENACTLASALHADEQWLEEQAELRRALRELRHLPPDAQFVRSSELELALWYSQCRSRQADLSDSRLQEINHYIQSKLGPLHRVCLKGKMVLADFYASHQRFMEAESLYMELQDQLIEAGRSLDLDMVETRFHLALILLARNNHQRAMNLLLANVGVAVQMSGENSALTLHNLARFAIAYKQSGNTDKAIQLMRSCAERSRITLGDRNQETMIRVRIFNDWKAASRRTSRSAVVI